MLSRRRLLALAAAAPVLAAGCAAPAGSALERARRTGVLRVGIAGERPYGYADADGRVTGSQPEVARAVLAGLGIDGLEAVQVRFADLLPQLAAGTFDLVTAGLAITAPRCREVAFSRPDLVAPPAFLVAEGNPLGIGTFQGVVRSGARLAVLDGSAEQVYALGAGLPPERLEVVDGQGTLFRRVVDGAVAAGALTAISLVDALRRNPGTGVEVTDPISPTLDGRTLVPAAAFATRPGETDLLAAFDAGLAALQASGEWLAITEPFGLGPDNLPGADLTTAELCT